jgi:hypothetical protein
MILSVGVLHGQLGYFPFYVVLATIGSRLISSLGIYLCALGFIFRCLGHDHLAVIVFLRVPSAHELRQESVHLHRGNAGEGLTGVFVGSGQPDDDEEVAEAVV